jgi:hypothetical protein
MRCSGFDFQFLILYSYVNLFRRLVSFFGHSIQELAPFYVECILPIPFLPVDALQTMSTETFMLLFLSHKANCTNVYWYLN